jgi:putative SOS response-associated peptidase YedK
MDGMCNRFRGLWDWSELPRQLSGKRINFAYNPNVAPTESVPALLVERGKESDVKLTRFGINLVSKDGKKRPPLLNVRIDTLRRGSFKTMLGNHRCIVPAEGFYEWREEGGAKQPYYFYRKDGKPILFAALWNNSDVKGDTVPAFAILTDEPNELVAPYHDRMPVILDDPETWLNPDTTLDALKPLGAEGFAVRPLSRAVNKVGEKDLKKIEAKND